MDSVRSGPFGQIFRPDNFIFGQVSSCFSLPIARSSCILNTSIVQDCQSLVRTSANHHHRRSHKHLDGIPPIWCMLAK